ncbi:MAG: hypothetical protein DHS20C15_22140 [Planctomycetota bacterium]|nr:MAG: hypothetical protein DHS20C15_22140 [Planctomycetota bacterium]
MVALLVCALVGLVVFWGSWGSGSLLSFDPSHPFSPRPWSVMEASAPDAERPAINPITSDLDFFVLPGMRRLEQLSATPPNGAWDSAQLLGYPLSANMPYPLHSPVWQALSWIDAEQRLGVVMWLHTAIAAWLAWRAARWLGCASPAASVAAVGTALSFWMSTRWHLPHVACAAVWWGGLIVAVERVRAGQRWWGLAEFALWGGLALRSGFPQVALLLIVGSCLWAVWQAWRSKRELWSTGLCLLGGLLLALLIGAPELGSVTRMYADSARANADTQAAALERGLEPGALFGALLPGFFGHPPDFARSDPPAPRMEDWLPRRWLLSDDIQDNVVEDALHPGVVLLALLPLAWAAAGAARRLLLFAAFWVTLALLFPWLAEHVPLVRPLGAGSIKRVLVLCAVSVPLAAALGLQASMDARVRLPKLGLGALTACLLATGCLPLFSSDPAADAWWSVLWPQALSALGIFAATVFLLTRAWHGAWRGYLIAALALLELGFLARGFNPFTSPSERFPGTPGLAALADAPGRVAVLGDGSLLPPPATALHGVRSLHGVAPLMNARTAQLLECIEPNLIDPRDPRVIAPFHDPDSLSHPLLDLLGVSRVVISDPTLPARTGLPVVGQFVDEGFGILARPDPLPLATYVTGARAVPDEAQRLALLADRSAPWRDSVLLDEELSDLALPERGSTHALSVTNAAPGMWQLDVTSEEAGLALVAEAWHADWRATVDGVDAPVLRAHHALMAVPVPAGSRSVSLHFEPPLREITRILALCGFALVLAAAALGFKFHRAASTR